MALGVMAKLRMVRIRHSSNQADEVYNQVAQKIKRKIVVFPRNHRCLYFDHCFDKEGIPK